MTTATATQTQRNSATSHETSPETMEAVILSGEMRGKIVHVTKSSDERFSINEPTLTSEEMEVLEAVVEASKKAEATAIRAGKTAERVIERMRRSTAELRGEVV